MDLVASTEFLATANAAPKDLKSKIIKVLSLLSNDPKHPSLHFKRVRGADPGIFECRIDQRYRMIVAKHKGVLRCLHLDDHDDALKKARNFGVNEKISVIEEISMETFSEEFWSFQILGDELKPFSQSI